MNEIIIFIAVILLEATIVGFPLILVFSSLEKMLDNFIILTKIAIILLFLAIFLIIVGVLS
jgi:hypothetical protein